jgi:hypothetical protein
MQEHLTPELMGEYRARNLRDQALLSVVAHLVTCAECRSKTAGIAAETRLADAMDGGHLSFEGLEALVKGGADGLDHVRSCPVCAAELIDLQVFAAEIRAEKKKPFRKAWRILVPVVAMAAVVLSVMLSRAVPEAAKVAVQPSIVASLHDGRELIALDQTGTLHGVSGIPAGELEQIATALRSGRIPAAALSTDLARPREILLGTGSATAELKPLMPVATLVSGETPVFRWTGPAGATRFKVAVYDADFNLVEMSPALATTEWTATRPLRRGKLYTWTVTATIRGAEVTAPHAPEPEARFRVASAEDAAVLENLKSANPVSDLRIALAAARLGLRDEAGAAITRLEQKNPGSPLVLSLRNSLRAR